MMGRQGQRCTERYAGMQGEAGMGAAPRLQHPGVPKRVGRHLRTLTMEAILLTHVR